MYKPVFFYALFVLTSTYAQAKNLKLATWNVEWLVSYKDIQITPIPKDIHLRSPEAFKRLRHYGEKLQADIIALQEVGSIETLSKIFPDNQYLYFITKDPIAQHTALAIRNNVFVKIEQNPDLIELNQANNSRPLRSGLDITLYTQTNSLRILVIHLKSGYQDYPLDRPKLKQSCTLLKEQQPILKKWIQKRLDENQAFIILGDFNRIISPNDLFFKTLSDKNLFYPTAYQANPCWEGNYFIDGFIINSKAKTWLQSNSLRVLKYIERGYNEQNQLSDHCPVSVKLSIP